MLSLLPTDAPIPRPAAPPADATGPVLAGGARPSLRVKLVAMCVLLVLALSALLLVQLPRAMDAQSRRWVVSRALGLGRLLARSLEAPLDFDDPVSAARVLDTLRTGGEARYAVALRADGTVLARWGEAAPPEQGPAGPAEWARIVGDRVHVRVPVAVRVGRGGALLIGLGLDELQERRADARRSVLWSAALFVALGIAAALTFGTLLTRPLARITDAARRVTSGQGPGAGELPVARRDEIGVLAGAFERMLARLDHQRIEIERINADLAERVRERTQELARTHAALAELERTQEQLVMADRRVSVGRLAAGVAHEVNNPMAALSGNLEFAAGELDALRRSVSGVGLPPAVAEVVEELSTVTSDCRRNAARVVHIVRSLKTFARDDEDRREVLRLDEPVEAAIDMAMHEIKHRARLVRAYGAVPHVLGNEVRLSQVFLNLLINAAQAVPGGGGDHLIRVRLDTAEDGRALAEVSDTGCGMTAEVMEHVFDPFFTTKPIGVGSGLGLSISRNIVQKLGGEISVRSAPGQGTTFRIHLPAAAPPGTRPPRGGEAVPAPLVRARRILVLDDDAEVAGAIVRLLRPAEVTAVQSGREALALLGGDTRFDAVLCDLMMPEMSGPEFHAAVLAGHPGYARRTVFMTGGAVTEASQRFVERWTGPLLDKPLDPDLLRRALDAVCS